MDRLTSHEIVVMFFGLGTLLAFAMFLGELVKRFNQPSVVGEILAGILLGPTLLGMLTPQWTLSIFPLQGPNALVLDGLTTLAISLFLLVAGMEVDLSTIWRQGKAALSVGIAGVALPFSLGFAVAWFLPNILSREPGTDPLIFALFIATALSITALPVIVKILMDLNLYRSDLGMVIVAAAVFDDLVGWIVFAIILGMMGTTQSKELDIFHTISLPLGFSLALLTVGRSLIHRILPWFQAHTTWPGGVLGLALSLGLFGAAFTEWIGIHAIFGSFLVGVAIGDSPHLREQTRSVIHQFVSFIFAPLFFASIGLRVNFITHFDVFLFLTLLLIAISGKIVGCALGARLSGMRWRESLAIGSGMIAKGTMGIILGLMALQNEVIGERMFVAIVVVSLTTSMLSGPMIQRILKRKKSCKMTDYLTAKGFLHRLRGATPEEAISELSGALCAASGLDAKRVMETVLAREHIMSTGIGNGVAVPHARLTGLNVPLICLGLSGSGIDFNAPDGEPARIILLILSPIDDDCAQLEIFADIAKTFRSKEMRKKALQVANYTEFLALVKTAEPEDEQ
jgi:Kef-type K+ transport system membrane component KefB/mannitol/fructose-specific phosphotransferase system IIA component (Ntr-type)